MTGLLKLCGAAILAVAALTVLRGVRKDISLFITLSAGVVVLAGALPGVAQIVSFVRDASAKTGVTEYAAVLLKAAGLAAVTDITARLCRSAGEESTASFVEFAGKTEILVLALPFISEILGLSLGLLGG